MEMVERGERVERERKGSFAHSLEEMPTADAVSELAEFGCLLGCRSADRAAADRRGEL